MVVQTEIDGVIPKRTSDILAKLAQEKSGQDVGVGVILDALRERGFGILIFLFALPNAILPITWVLGLPVLLFGLQLAVGFREPWLPQKMRRATLGSNTFKKLTDYSTKYIRILENWSKPRLAWLTSGIMERLIGLYIVAVTIILLVPVPFGNALPSFGIGVMAVGLLERDGIVLAIGALIGVLGTIWVLLVAFLGWAAIKSVLGF
jgi:hypothetical protein